MAEHRVTRKQIRDPDFVLVLNTGEHHKVIVEKKKLAHLLDFEEARFRTMSAVLLPEGQGGPVDGEGPSSTTGLVASCLQFVAENSGVKALVAGHTDTTGTDDYNAKLSKLRAQAVAAALSGEREKFAEACDGPHLESKEKKLAVTKKDRIQILDWVSHSLGWPCSLEQNGKDYVRAVRAFQTSYNQSARAGNASGEDLAVDGDWGPKTWGAVFDCYDAKLAEELGVEVADLGEVRKKLEWLSPKTPFVGCGEYHPIDKAGQDEYRSQTNRRVEVLFFEDGEAPELECRSGGCAKQGCELFDPFFFQRKKMPLGQRSKVVSIDDFYWRTLGVQYLDRPRIEFDAGIWSIFGDDIPQDAVDALWAALKDGSFPRPKYEFVETTPPNTMGYYRDGTIFLLEGLVKQGRLLPERRWQLFLVMAEEFGHHVDHILRTQYSTVGGDAPGDEGTFFAADFAHFHGLLDKDFEFATVELESADGERTSAKYDVKGAEVPRDVRRKDLLDIDDPTDDHGTVRMSDGREVEVEFFSIRGAGAAHEEITKKGATAAQLPYDFRLDEGCAWPDMPCENEESVETCYYATWRNVEKEGTMAFRSHHGDLQYYHSMCPTGSPTNGAVVELIIARLKWLYERAINNSIWPTFQGNGLFHLGKMVHTVQDSYTRSHCWRDDTTKRVVSFQDYNLQDPKKHSEADKITAPGVSDALEATTQIMRYFRNRLPFAPEVEKYLRETVYALAPDAAGKTSGGTRPEYAK